MKDRTGVNVYMCDLLQGEHQLSGPSVIEWQAGWPVNGTLKEPSDLISGDMAELV